MEIENGRAADVDHHHDNMKLIHNLHQYCAIMTENRDASHGVEHMDQVRKNSINIWNNERLQLNNNINENRVERLIIAASQLHDVADHKYGQTTEQLRSVSTELKKYFSEEDVLLLMEIMDKVSYSKEAKLRKLSNLIPTWEELGVEGQLVRNIVSDADKLEAIGMIGVQRCLQYSYEVMKSRDEDINVDELLTHLEEHGKEKLFILKDEYIRTSTGKQMAEIPHNIMLEEVQRLKQLQENNPSSFNVEMMKHIHHSCP